MHGPLTTKWCCHPLLSTDEARKAPAIFQRFRQPGDASPRAWMSRFPRIFWLHVSGESMQRWGFVPTWVSFGLTGRGWLLAKLAWRVTLGSELPAGGNE